MYGADEEVGDYTDVLNGRDIKVECTKGAQYKDTSVRPAMKQTPLSDDSDFIKTCLEEQPQIETMYKAYTFDEIKGFLQEWLNPEEAEEEEGSSIVDGPATDFEPENKVKTQKSAKVEVVTDDDFDDLFEEEA
jgi:hypothetical protein